MRDVIIPILICGFAVFWIGKAIYKLIQYRHFFPVRAKCVGYTNLIWKSNSKIQYCFGKYEYEVNGEKYITSEQEPVTTWWWLKKNKKCKVYVSDKWCNMIISGYWKREQIHHIIMGILSLVLGIVGLIGF